MSNLELSDDEKILVNNLLVRYGRKLSSDIKIADDNGVPDYEEYLDDKAEYETVIKLIEKWNAV
ncbi:MAG: hypothetical protein ACTH64_15880 [Providencia sp.]|uniref:hypothetical protein n=1 Tax=Psychrobacter sp. TaxID=56811 RepID=UPI002648FE59|nr:hypothetical protein [Psychrobacter sp.]MDN5619692.1 hypothetical protein [Psychrobacter sp.]MDN5653090.1 hypothetical protein [Lactococcus lactis]